jgi:hypothetical protein
MKHLLISLLIFTFITPAYAAKLTDDQVKQRIIDESIAEYPGNCPCPYNRAHNGSSCGKRSAYSKPGGYAPICYKTDVSKEMIQAWRQRNQE